MKTRTGEYWMGGKMVAVGGIKATTGAGVDVIIQPMTANGKPSKQACVFLTAELARELRDQLTAVLKEIEA